MSHSAYHFPSPFLFLASDRSQACCCAPTTRNRRSLIHRPKRFSFYCDNAGFMSYFLTPRPQLHLIIKIIHNLLERYSEIPTNNRGARFKVLHNSAFIHPSKMEIQRQARPSFHFGSCAELLANMLLEQLLSVVLSPRAMTFMCKALRSRTRARLVSISPFNMLQSYSLIHHGQTKSSLFVEIC